MLALTRFMGWQKAPERSLVYHISDKDSLDGLLCSGRLIAERNGRIIRAKSDD